MKATKTAKWPSMQGEPITWYQYAGAWYPADETTADMRAGALPYTNVMVGRYNDRIRAERGADVPAWFSAEARVA